MLSVSDVWKMMNEKHSKSDHTTVSMRLENTRMESFIRTTFGTTKPKKPHAATPLSKYDPPLRAHEDWRLTRGDRCLIERAKELGLIPDTDDDCREDLIAAYAITDEQWATAEENYRTSSNKDEEWEVDDESWEI